MARPRDVDAAERIVAATRTLLAERGPACVGIDEIAAQAGVAKATIYRWWGSRDALVLDALVQMSEPVLRNDDGATRERIATQMRRLGALLTSPTGSLLRELVATAQGDPKLADEFRQRFFAVRREYALATLRAGVERGEVRTDVDVDTLLDIISGPIWQRFLLGHAPIGPRAIDRLVDAIWPAVAPSGHGPA
jgi:AcrR family transcriptional regulator